MGKVNMKVRLYQKLAQLKFLLSLASQGKQEQAERALANAIARKHEEDCRMRALELSLGIRKRNVNDERY